MTAAFPQRGPTSDGGKQVFIHVCQLGVGPCHVGHVLLAAGAGGAAGDVGVKGAGQKGATKMGRSSMILEREMGTRYCVRWICVVPQGAALAADCPGRSNMRLSACILKQRRVRLGHLYAGGLKPEFVYTSDGLCRHGVHQGAIVVPQLGKGPDCGAGAGKVGGLTA